MPARHKGIMSDAGIDRRWPHQVALHAELCMMDQFAPIHSYACHVGGAPRWRHVVKLEPHGYHATYNLIPFATREAAEAFIARFGGRHFDPATDRMKPKRQNVWTRSEWGSTAERYPEIIARLERVRSFEPGLDFDIAYLLDMPRVRFTYSQYDVETFLAEAIPSGEWVVKQVDKGLMPVCGTPLIMPGAMPARIGRRREIIRQRRSRSHTSGEWRDHLRDALTICGNCEP